MDDSDADLKLRSGFRLGDWTVLPDQNRIEGESGAFHLEPKVMEVLCLLAHQGGSVVSRNDLLEAVWNGRYASDEVLSRAVSVLRSQLGDNHKNPEYIATVPKAGYRLIKAVEPFSDSTNDKVATPPPPAMHKKWPPAALLAGLLLLFAATGYLFTSNTPTPPLDPRSPTLFADISDWFELIIRGDISQEAVTDIAVLPFEDLSEQAGNAFFGDGLTDELISSLGQLDGLKVVARRTSLSYRNRHQDVREIGELLQVQGIIEGTVKRSGNQIRISAQLSSTRDGYVLWSQTFDRNLSDLLELQLEISNEIVSALQEHLGLAAQQQTQAEQNPPDMDAYQLYLNGRFLWKLRGESPLRTSVALFEKALQLDPAYMRARIALANSLVLLPSYSSEDEDSTFARALSILDEVGVSSAAEAGEMEAIRGFIAFRQWQWQMAEDQFHKALLLAPKNPNIYVWYSQLLSALGRNADALKTARQARDLDAVSPVVNHRLAIAYLWNNDNVRAAEQFAQGAGLGFVNLRSPGYLIFLLRMQRFEEARRVIKSLYADSSSDPDWLMDNIEQISTGTGERGLARAAQEAITRGDILPRLRLGLWLYLDDPERVYEVVQALHGDKKYLDIELIFAAEGQRFRESGEFSDLSEEIGLEDYWENRSPPDAE